MHRLLLCLVVSAALVLPAAAVARGGGAAPAPAGGSAKVVAALPADFPADVVLPAGQLTGSSGAAPSWSVGLLVDGAYPDVMARVHDFYVARGYSQLGATWMYSLTDGIHTVTFVGRNHDHSASRTDLTIQVANR
ncbi:MAG: hypothetical protein QOD69_66 [Solirubrobacteraceae bacterium]|jgi:hypothetical protein|nr:hypothetical protein [Solirubrobacteraceae bacterium]